MATTKKKTTNKKTVSNSKKKTNTKTVVSKKKNSTNKNTKNTKTTNKKNIKNTKNTKTIKEVVKVEETKKKETIFNENANIAEELRIIKANIKKTYKEIKNKFKKMPMSYKTLIGVGFICILIIVCELTFFLINRSNRANNTVYHDSYNALVANNGNIVIAGNSDFKYSKVNDYTGGNSKGKLIKYKENGEVLFEIKYDRGISNTFNDVIETADGYIVVGTGIFSKEEKETEQKEAVMIKYDKNGKLVWEKFYHVLSNTGFEKVIETEDGYIAIGHSIYANMELGNHTTGGGIIVKYDKEGNEVWHNNHGGTKSGKFNDIVIVGSDIYVAGKDGADSGNIVKFNANGEYQWHKNYSYTDSYGLTGISYANDGLYVIGSKKIFTKEVKETDDRYTTNTDALLLKYDLNGNLLFEKTFGGSSYERYNSIYLFHNNFYVVGHICSKDAGLKVINDKEDEMTGLLVRYDINGNILKKEVFGGSNNDNLTDITSDSISFYAVGYSNSNDSNADADYSNGKDYFGELIKLNNRFKKIYSK